MEPRNHQTRVALFPLPFQGHLNPMIHLANILHDRGISVILLHTKFNAPDPSQHPNLTFRCIHEKFDQATAQNDAGSLIFCINDICVDPFRNSLSRLLTEEEGPIACLITDAAFYFTQAVADGFNVPRMALRTGGASCYVLYNNFYLLKEKGYFPIQESRRDDTVVEFPPIKVKDLPFTSKLDPGPLHEILVNMVNATKRCSGLILNTFEGLEGLALATLRRELIGVPVYPIGPFHKLHSNSTTTSSSDSSRNIEHAHAPVPHRGCVDWLDKQAPKSVIYVSFGSVGQLKESELVEIAYGIYNSNFPFLWVVREGLEWLPVGLLENLKQKGSNIVTWAPQLDVLAHPAVGVFWTHNGWNSTLESICEGVPMMCNPMFADQMVNARYVCDVWGIGLNLVEEEGVGLERGKVVEVVRRLMVAKEGEEIRERATRLKEMVDACLKPDSSSYQSVDQLVRDLLSGTRQL